MLYSTIGIYKIIPNFRKILQVLSCVFGVDLLVPCTYYWITKHEAGHTSHHG